MRQDLELHAGRARAGVGVVGNHVLPPEFGRVHAELLRGEVDDALGQRHCDRVADRAVLAGDVLVGEDDVQLRPVVLVLVGAAGQVDHLVALDAAGARVDRVGADGREVVEVEGEDLAGLGGRQAHLDLVLPRMDVGEERLHPVRHELDRPAQHDRQRGRAHLIRVHMHLDAVGASDVAADHAHVRFGQVQVLGEDVLHHVRRLRGVVHGERVLGGVVVGEDRPALQAHAGVPAEVELFLDHHVGPGEGVLHRAEIHFAVETNVVAQIRVDHVAPGERFLHVDHRRQGLVFGDDQFAGVFGLRASLGHHCCDRLALRAGAVDGDRVLWRGFQALEVREHADPRRAVLGHGAAVHDGDDARRRARLREIQALDHRVSMRAAQEHDVGEPRKAQVIDERPAPLQQALGVGARLGLADVAGLQPGLGILDGQFVAGGHFCAPWVLSPPRRRTSTVSIASTMAW